jgi:molybdenum cofactor cytidylyltransferase
MQPIAAILLASGFSRRFGGEDKLLYPYDGKPLARHTLDLVIRMNRFSPIVFVAARDEVAALARAAQEDTPRAPIRIARNTNALRGQCESVRVGVETAGPVAGYCFFPCDMPRLSPQDVAAILARAAPGRIVRPFHQGTPGNPCLFAAAFRDDLLNLADGERPARIIARKAALVVPVPDAGPGVLWDLDYPPETPRA